MRRASEMVSAASPTAEDEYPLDPGFPDRADAELTAALRVPQQGPDPETMDPIHCRVYFQGDVRFDRYGTAKMTVEIPFQYRSHVMRLVEAAAYPMEMYLRPSKKVRRDPS